MMRKSQIYKIAMLAALTALGASCSQDETIGFAQQEIRFVAETDTPPTRSGSHNLPTDYVMWVHGVYHNAFDGHYNLIFPQCQEFVANSSGIWSHNGDPLYYPTNGTIDFLAFALTDPSHKPTATYSPTTFDDEHSTFSALTLDFGNKLDGTDAIVFSDLCAGAPCGSSATTQSLHFRNAMAKIVFNALTEENSTAERFVINQLTVRNVKTSGVLSITPHTTLIVEGESTGSTLEWTSTSNTISISQLSANQAVTLVPTAVGSPIYLPKQSGTPLDIEVDLTYSFQPVTGPTFGPERLTLTLKDTNWLPGQQYTYTITCNLKQIKVECQTTGAIIDYTPEDIDFDEQYHGKTPV